MYLSDSGQIRAALQHVHSRKLENPESKKRPARVYNVQRMSSSNISICYPLRDTKIQVDNVSTYAKFNEVG